MKNISFDNPYLLLLAIPLLLLIIIPYIISVSKDNKTVGWKISLVLHVLIAFLVTAAIAGLMSMTVLTKTTVYVVADVSYSSERNLDQIDEYIAEIKESLPVNSKLGVVCFGKNYVQLTPAGRTLKSVSQAKVNDSATDIVGALNYTESLFTGGTIKRIVLITDGNDTVSRNSSGLAATVERLTDNNIKVDTIFLNNTLLEGQSEVQLSQIDFNNTTYLGHETNAKILIQSSDNDNVKVELFSRPKTDGAASAGEFSLVSQTIISVEAGFNTVSMALPAETSGTFEYKVVITGEKDFSPHNNTRTFVQTVVGKVQTLLITGNPDDVALIESVYGEQSDIDSYVIGQGNNSVPFMFEELIVYDEIIVSNVDIRNIKNINAFVNSLDIVISQFGKSLITFGDLGLQDEIEDPILIKFQELLPVDYGNSSRDGKLYTIVLDVSHSMYMAYKLRDACDVAIKLISLLNDDDYLCFITFSGAVTVKSPELVDDCKQEVIDQIVKISEQGKTGHGTDIGVGLEEALKSVNDLGLQENQVMLISDGKSFDSTVDSIQVATELFSNGTPVSAIAVYTNTDGESGKNNLRNIVKCGTGGVYNQIRAGAESTDGLVFGSIADSVTESVIDRESSVNIVRYKDGIAAGISSVPKISCYIQSGAKYDATVPLTINYVKPSGYMTTVPLYAYRYHGNGRTASLTTDLNGSWTRNWSDEFKATLISNMIVSNTPKENLDNPYTVRRQTDRFDTYLEIVPSTIYPTATTSIRIVMPNGQVIKRDLVFDSQKYSYTFESTQVGKYNVQIIYSYMDTKYVTDINFENAYLPEHDAFTTFDKANVYEFMRNYGGITEGEIPNLENDANEISTHKISYSIPLLIAAVALFVIDVIIRKLRISERRKKKIARAQRKGEKVA